MSEREDLLRLAQMADARGDRETALAALRKLEALGQPEAPSGFVRGMRDPVDSAAQMLERAVPESWRRSINEFNDWLVDKGVPLARLGEGGLQELLVNQEQAYQQARADAGETGFDWGRLAGNVASPANLAVASRLPAATSVMGRLGSGALGGAILAPMGRPITDTEEKFWERKAEQSGIGALTGLASSGLLQGLGYLGRQARRPEVASLRAQGVQPTIGQTLGGAVSRTEEKLASVPVLGDAIAGARQRAKEQFNTAAINEVLKPIGKEVTGAGQKAIGQAHRAISKVYDDAANSIPFVRIDQQAVNEINTLRGMMPGALEATEKNFRRFFDSAFMRKIGPKATMDSRTFKAIDSLLGKRIRESKDMPELQDAFKEFQRILRDSAARQHPAYAQAKQAADSAWARLVRVEDAAQRAINQEGIFTPGQLGMSARSADATMRRSATARGESLMQDLATRGQNVLGNVVPNSGTVDRGLLASILAGGLGVVPPIVPALMGAGHLLYTPTGQAALNAIARNMPNFTGTAGAAYGGMLGGMR